MFLCFNQEARKREKKTLECWAAAAILLQTSLLEYIDFTDYTASSRRWREHLFSVFNRGEHIDSIQRENSTDKSSAHLHFQPSEHVSSFPCGSYHLLSIHYWPIGLCGSQVSEEGGNRNELITGRAPLIRGWPHFMWDALQETLRSHSVTGWRHWQIVKKEIKEFFSSYTVRSRSRRWETHSLWLEMSKTLLE